MKQLILTGIFTAFVLTSFGQNSLLWKIEAESGQTSYLFGTMHVVSKEKFFIPKAVENAMKRCNKVVFEVSSEPDQDEVIRLGQFEEGQMSDYLNQAQKDSLYSYIEKTMGLDSVKYEYTLGKFKPFVFTQFPFMDVLMQGKSIDMALMKMANDRDLEVNGLETYAEQLGYFDALPDSMQNALIMSVVRDTSSPKRTWNRLETNYLNQDLNALSEEVHENGALQTFMSNKILAERNHRWVELLSDQLEQEPLFIAVGAGHLPGEQGLLQLLRDEGFKVTPLKISMYP